MTERAQQTRAALIQATIDEIERAGLAKVTIRAIAQRAGANVAAVNYHFGSKAGLVQAVLASTRAHMLADARGILAGTLSVAEAVQPPLGDPAVQPPSGDLAVQPPLGDPADEPPLGDPADEPPSGGRPGALDGRRSSSGAAAGALDVRQALVNLMTYLLEGAMRYPQLTQVHASKGETTRDFEALIAEVATSLRTAVRGLSMPDARRRSVAALSSIFFSCFHPHFFGEASPSTASARQRYIETIVDGLVAEAAPSRPKTHSPRRKDR